MYNFYGYWSKVCVCMILDILNNQLLYIVNPHTDEIEFQNENNNQAPFIKIFVF